MLLGFRPFSFMKKITYCIFKCHFCPEVQLASIGHTVHCPGLINDKGLGYQTCACICACNCVRHRFQLFFQILKCDVEKVESGASSENKRKQRELKGAAAAAMETSSCSMSHVLPNKTCWINLSFTVTVWTQTQTQRRIRAEETNGVHFYGVFFLYPSRDPKHFT